MSETYKGERDQLPRDTCTTCKKPEQPIRFRARDNLGCVCVDCWSDFVARIKLRMAE
jgi:hypothetical protein